MNWYVYCGSNPLIYTDPSGLENKNYLKYLKSRTVSRKNDPEIKKSAEGFLHAKDIYDSIRSGELEKAGEAALSFAENHYRTWGEKYFGWGTDGFILGLVKDEKFANLGLEYIFLANEIQLNSQLKNTDKFLKTVERDALKHIFYGETKGGKIGGRPQGMHYEGLITHYGTLPSSMGPGHEGDIEVLERSDPDEQGVYTATWKFKDSDKTKFSTMFPIDYTPQQVVDAINEAYENQVVTVYNKNDTVQFLEGKTSKGMRIRLYVDKDNKITNAHPVQDRATVSPEEE